MQQINKVSFRLELPQHFRINSKFHISFLKPVTPGSLDEFSPLVIPPEPLDMDGEPTYIIKDILMSQHRAGNLEYLGGWEGYGPEDQSWVQAKDTLDPFLFKAFTVETLISQHLNKEDVLARFHSLGEISNCSQVCLISRDSCI